MCVKMDDPEVHRLMPYFMIYIEYLKATPVRRKTLEKQYGNILCEMENSKTISLIVQNKLVRAIVLGMEYINTPKTDGPAFLKQHREEVVSSLKVISGHCVGLGSQRKNIYGLQLDFDISEGDNEESNTNDDISLLGEVRQLTKIDENSDDEFVCAYAQVEVVRVEEKDESMPLSSEEINISEGHKELANCETAGSELNMRLIDESFPLIIEDVLGVNKAAATESQKLSMPQKYCIFNENEDLQLSDETQIMPSSQHNYFDKNLNSQPNSKFLANHGITRHKGQIYCQISETELMPLSKEELDILAGVTETDGTTINQLPSGTYESLDCRSYLDVPSVHKYVYPDTFGGQNLFVKNSEDVNKSTLNCITPQDDIDSCRYEKHKPGKKEAKIDHRERYLSMTADESQTQTESRLMPTQTYPMTNQDRLGVIQRHRLHLTLYGEVINPNVICNMQYDQTFESSTSGFISSTQNVSLPNETYQLTDNISRTAQTHVPGEAFPIHELFDKLSTIVEPPKIILNSKQTFTLPNNEQESYKYYEEVDEISTKDLDKISTQEPQYFTNVQAGNYQDLRKFAENAWQFDSFDGSQRGILVKKVLTEKLRFGQFRRRNITYEVGEYLTLTEIGKGGNGTVYLCDVFPVDFKFVEKRIPILRFRQEEILTLLERCPFMPEIYGLTVQDGYVSIFMEYATGGTLRDQEFSTESNHPDFYAILKTFRSIVKSVVELNKLGIIHYDIKPDNVLLSTKKGVNKGTTYLLADFGASIFQQNIDGPEQINFDAGTWEHYPPEHKDIRCLTDWSDLLKHESMTLGHLLYYMVTKERLWKSKFDELKHQIKRHDSHASEQFIKNKAKIDLLEHISNKHFECYEKLNALDQHSHPLAPEVINLLYQLLEYDVDLRSIPEEIMKHQAIVMTDSDLDGKCGNLSEAAISNDVAQVARFATPHFVMKENTEKNIPGVDKGIEKMAIHIGNTTIAESSYSDSEESSSNLDILDRTDLSNLPNIFSLRMGDQVMPTRMDMPFSYSETIECGGIFGQSESVDTTALKTIGVDADEKDGCFLWDKPLTMYGRRFPENKYIVITVLFQDAIIFTRAFKLVAVLGYPSTLGFPRFVHMQTVEQNKNLHTQINHTGSLRGRPFTLQQLEQYIEGHARQYTNDGPILLTKSQPLRLISNAAVS